MISPFVIRAIGARQAHRWFLTGEAMDAATALRLGLVHETADAAALAAAAGRLFDALQAGGPEAQIEIKRLLRRATGRSPAGQPGDARRHGKMDCPHPGWRRGRRRTLCIPREASRPLAPSSLMLRRLLIANRGEIAGRIMRTADGSASHGRRLFGCGRRRLHVRSADEAVLHRTGPGRKSYLVLASNHRSRASQRAPRRSIRATASCRRTPHLPKLCDAAGSDIRRSTASAIRAMGLKDAAKALMAAAGVPVMPGYHGR